jgi:DNA modification methylase
LRSYTDDGEHYEGQIGSEATPGEFIEALLECTREMVRVLKPSGSIFVNLGDVYSCVAARAGSWAVLGCLERMSSMKSANRVRNCGLSVS